MNSKQIFVAGCSFFLGAGVVSAASYQPFAPQGGLAITTLLPGVYSDGSDGTLEQTARMADSSVQQADANKPNGYVQPDSTGAVTLPVKGSVASAPANDAGDTVATIASTAKAAQVTAGSAVQQSTANKPSGYAQPDSNGNVTLPVTGTTNLSPVTSSAPNSGHPRYLADRFSDHYNLADLGAKLDNSSSDLATIQTIYNALPDGSVVDIPRWSQWTGNIPTPNPSKHITWHLGGNLPGAYTPPPGDGDTAIFYGGGSFHAQKRDTTATSFGYPAYFMYWNDDSNYTGMWGGNFQQYAPAQFKGISGPSSKGHTSAIDINLDSYGQNPSDSYDVAINSYVTKFGQNSTWGILDNMGDISGRVPGFAASWNEFDVWTNGYDIKPWDPSYGSPQAGHRSVFFVAAGHNKRFNAWAANQSVSGPSTAKGSLPVPHLLDVTGSDGVHYIWYPVQGGTTGATQPTFPLSSQFVGTLSKGVLTVTSMDRGTINVGDYLIGEIPIHPPQITSQLSGTTGGVGTYAVADTTSSVSSPVALSAAPHVTDGTVIWEYGQETNSSISSLLYYTGSPGDAVDTMVGAKEGIILGNAAVDTSLMTFQKNSAAVRVASGQPIDFSGNGTKSGSNLHTLDYDNGNLNYKVGGSTKFYVSDNGPAFVDGLRFFSHEDSVLSSPTDFVLSHSPKDGSTQGAQISIQWTSPQAHLVIDNIDFGAIRASRNMTKANILAINNAAEGETVYDTDDHTEVQYRCPTASTCGWFPLQYGAALSN